MQSIRQRAETRGTGPHPAVRRRRPALRSPAADRLLGLQNSAGNRVAGRLVDGGSSVAGGTEFPGLGGRRVPGGVQRAILAVDGPSDNGTAKAATLNCLTNLKSHKKVDTPKGKTVVEHPAGDARGQVFGPATKATAVGGLKGGTSSVNPIEALYFLGHGSMADIAGIPPADLAGDLIDAFAGYGKGTYVGALKIVACYSASTVEDGKSSPTSYASRVKTELDRRKDATYQPRFVEGIKGIAWADEETGERVGYEVLGERPGKLSPLETIYTDSRVKQWFAALTEPDPVKRKADMDKILVEAHKKEGLPPEQARRILGKAARERYVTGSPLTDLGVATEQLTAAVKESPPNKKLAAAALKRMRLDWGTMEADERKGQQSGVIRAYEGYLVAFEGRRTFLGRHEGELALVRLRAPATGRLDESR